ncbi:MAG: hypothetical protein KGV56_05320 [Gammaproteobacteria bacterium]|nr:hypothetical protein [Gammaproteobacteria bacterium]
MKNKQEEITLFIAGLNVEHTFSNDDIDAIKEQNKSRLRNAKKNDFLLMATRIFSLTLVPFLLSMSITALLVGLIGIEIEPQKADGFDYGILWNIGTMLFISLSAIAIAIKFLKYEIFLPLSNYRKELYISLYHSLGVDFHKQVRKAVSQHILDPNKNPFVKYEAIFHSSNPRFLERFSYEIPMKEMDRLLLGRGLSLYDRRKKCSAKTEAKNV